MERTNYLEYYRIRTNRDGTPIELSRIASAITYEAADERSEETVALTLIPTESIVPAVQQQFQERARAIQNFRHINIAKLLEFGREDENFVCVSEYLRGTTLAAWVGHHGPMPADATLRIAEQVVSALSSATFHKLALPGVQPSNIIVLPGVTPEGTWPLIKLTDLGLLGFKQETTRTDEGDISFAIPPELAGADRQEFPSSDSTGDFRSQIYSLGGTMYFLLTGAIVSTPVRPRQLRTFPKPLRALLSQMLRRNPGQRPGDPIALAEMIRDCLSKIERRQKLARQFGIPLVSKTPIIKRERHWRMPRVALATCAIALVALLITALVSAGPIGRLLHRNRARKAVGVLVGIPETSPAPVSQNASGKPPEPATVLSEAASSAATFANPTPATDVTPANSAQTSARDLQQTETAQSSLPTGTSSPEAVANSPTPTGSVPPEATPQSPVASNSTSRSKRKRTTAMPSGRMQSTRAQLVGITSDGRLILRLPSGRTTIVAPDGEQEEFVPRRHRRAIIDREETFVPPLQPFDPESPYD